MIDIAQSLQDAPGREICPICGKYLSYAKYPDGREFAYCSFENDHPPVQ